MNKRTLENALAQGGNIEDVLVRRAGNTQGSLAGKVKMHDWLLVGIGVVVVVAFAAMLVTVGAMVNDSLAEKKAISQDMRDQIKAQNDEIEDLSDRVNELTNVLKNSQDGEAALSEAADQTN